MKIKTETLKSLKVKILPNYMKNEHEVGPDYSKEDMAVKRENNMKNIKDKRETLELCVNHQF